MSDSILSHLSDRAKERVVVSFAGLPLPGNLTPRYDKAISLGGGRPHHGFFPVNSINLEVTNEPFSDDTITSTIHKVDKKSTTNGHSNGTTNGNAKVGLDIKEAFQYGPTEGHQALLDFAKDLITYVNKPGYDDWDLTFTSGTGDSLHKIFNLLINPGDVVLIENFTYVPVIGNIKNYGGEVIPVALNFEKKGIDVELLREQLENWETKHPGYKRPKALYTIPTGQNPTGLSIPNEERAKLYKLAQEFDFIIVEDDPYGYIQLGKYTDGVANIYDDKSLTAEEFISKTLPNSYIRYDTDGRVIRLESFSKVFAPGTRLGFITGYSKLIKQIVKHTGVSTRASSGISQVILYNVIKAFGGEAKNWIDWTLRVSKYYTDRKNSLLKSLYESSAYKKGYFEVIEPESGMFTVLNINFPKPEAGAEEDYRNQLEKLRYKTIEHGVIVVLGKNMTFSEDEAKKARFIRLTLASASDTNELVEAGKRLGDAIADYFESK